MGRLRPVRGASWTLLGAYRVHPWSTGRAGLRKLAYKMVGQYDDTDRDEEIVGKLRRSASRELIKSERGPPASIEGERGPQVKGRSKQRRDIDEE